MKILLLNQAFYPDQVATSQYAADLACGLAAEGHRVTVLCSARGYDDPALRFPPQEHWNGVHIVRIQGSSFGKGAKWRRAADFASFLAACALRLPRLGRFDAIVALTTPPLISVFGAAWKSLTGGRLIYWTMDLNPDEAIAAGWLDPSSTAATVLAALNRYSLRRSDSVVVLDSFMRRRLIEAGTAAEKISVIPPWSQDDAAHFDREGREYFRRTQGWEDKFVVMYSGNHSPCHPLQTLVDAAHALRSHQEILFAFVGGGSEYHRLKAQAEAGRWPNVCCLPYQPLPVLSASLSAADLHTVVMGDPFVGIISPSKIYNILAVGAPVLYIGPEQSHVTELMAALADAPDFYPARHADSATVVAHILRARQRAASRHAVTHPAISKSTLLPQMKALVTGERQQFVFSIGRASSVPATPLESH